MQPLRVFIQSAGRPEVGQPELAAGVLDAVPKDIERPPPLDL